MSTVLSRLLNDHIDQSMPSMDNKAATVIHGCCSVAASTMDLEVTDVAKNCSGTIPQSDHCSGA